MMRVIHVRFGERILSVRLEGFTPSAGTSDSFQNPKTPQMHPQPLGYK